MAVTLDTKNSNNRASNLESNNSQNNQASLPGAHTDIEKNSYLEREKISKRIDEAFSQEGLTSNLKKIESQGFDVKKIEAELKALASLKYALGMNQELRRVHEKDIADYTPSPEQIERAKVLETRSEKLKSEYSTRWEKVKEQLKGCSEVDNLERNLQGFALKGLADVQLVIKKQLEQYQAEQREKINNQSWTERLIEPVLRIIHQSPEMIKQQGVILFRGLGIMFYETSKEVFAGKSIKEAYQNGVSKSAEFIEEYRKFCEGNRQSNRIGSILGGTADFAKGNLLSDLITLHPIVAYANPVMEVVDAAYDEALLKIINTRIKLEGGTEKIDFLTLKELQTTDSTFIAGKFALDIGKIASASAVNPYLASQAGIGSGGKALWKSIRTNLIFSGVISTGEELKHLSLPALDSSSQESQGLLGRIFSSTANIAGNTLRNTANSMGMGGVSDVAKKSYLKISRLGRTSKDKLLHEMKQRSKIENAHKIYSTTDDTTDFLESVKDASLNIDFSNPLSIAGHALVLGATGQDLAGEGIGSRSGKADPISNLQDRKREKTDPYTLRIGEKEIEARISRDRSRIFIPQDLIQEVCMEVSLLNHNNHYSHQLTRNEVEREVNSQGDIAAFTDYRSGIIYLPLIDENMGIDQKVLYKKAEIHEVEHLKRFNLLSDFEKEALLNNQNEFQLFLEADEDSAYQTSDGFQDFADSYIAENDSLIRPKILPSWNIKDLRNKKGRKVGKGSFVRSTRGILSPSFAIALMTTERVSQDAQISKEVAKQILHERNRLLIISERPDAIDSYLRQEAERKKEKYIRIRLNSPNDFNRASKSIRIDESGNYQIKDGAFKEILTKGGILYLDATGADAVKVEEFNSLYGDIPFFDGNIASPKLKIIVSFPESQKDEYANTLLSRSFVVSDSHPALIEEISNYQKVTDVLQQGELLATQALPRNIKNPITVDLFNFGIENTPLLEQILLGRAVVDAKGKYQYVTNGLVVEGRPCGVIQQAINENRPLVLQGAPWSNPEFLHFVEQLFSKRKIIINGEEIKLPRNFKIIFQKKSYRLTENRQLYRPGQLSISDQEQLWCINLATQDKLFFNVTVGKKSQVIEKGGLLSSANSYVRLRITTDLDRGTWNQIMHSEFKGIIEVVPGVKIPEEYQELFDFSSNAEAKYSPGAEQVFVYEGDDLEYVQAVIEENWGREKQLVYRSLGSGSSVNSLFQNVIQDKKRKEKLKHLELELLENLKKGKVVVLLGIETNAEFLNNFPGLLSEKPHLIINGEYILLNSMPGKLILVRKTLAHQDSYYSFSTRVQIAEGANRLAPEVCEDYFKYLCRKGVLKESQKDDFAKVWQVLQMMDEIKGKGLNFNLAQIRNLCRLYHQFKDNWLEAFQVVWSEAFKKDPEFEAYVHVLLRMKFGKNFIGKPNLEIYGANLAKILNQIKDDNWATCYWQLLDILDDKTLHGLRELESFESANRNPTVFEIIKKALLKSEMQREDLFDLNSPDIIGTKIEFLLNRFSLDKNGNYDNIPDIDWQTLAEYQNPDLRTKYIEEIAAAVKFVFLKGPAGTGKSYLQKRLNSRGKTIIGPYTLGSRMSDQDLFGNDEHPGPLRKLALQANTSLALDEANLGNSRALNQLVSLDGINSGLWIDGFWHDVDNANIIFSGNPETVEGRKRIELIENNGVTIFFDRFETAYLNKIFKNYFDFVQEDERASLKGMLINLHNFFSDLSPECEYTIRDLQEVINRICINQVSPRDALAILKIIFDVYSLRLSDLKFTTAIRWIRECYQIDLISEIEIAREEWLTKNRKHYYDKVALATETIDYLIFIENCLRNREARIENSSGLPTSGKRAMLALGPSGWGKDSVMEVVLENNSYVKGEISELLDPNVQSLICKNSRRFYLLSSNMRVDELEKIINVAKKLGVVLVLQEMNFLKTEILESRLNDILANETSEGEEAESGFYFMGTLNGWDFKGRNKVSTPLLSRCNVFQAHDHSIDGVRKIVDFKLRSIKGKIAQAEIEALVDFHFKLSSLSNESQDKPTNREILRAIELIAKYSLSWKQAVLAVYDYKLNGREISQITNNSKNEDKTQWAFLETYVNSLVSVAHPRIKVFIQEQTRRSYFDSVNNKFVISTVLIAQGIEAVYSYIRKEIALVTFTRNSFIDWVEQATENLNLEWSFNNDNEIANMSEQRSVSYLISSLQSIWCLLGKNSSLPIAKEEYVSFQEQQATGIIKNQDFKLLLSRVLEERDKLTARNFFCDVMLAYAVGHLSKNDIITFSKLIEENNIYFSDNPLSYLIRSFPDIDSILAEVPVSSNEEQIKFQQWKVLRNYQNILNNYLQITFELIAPESGKISIVPPALNEAQKLMSLNAQDLGESKKSDQETKERIRKEKKDLIKRIEEEFLKIEKTHLYSYDISFWHLRNLELLRERLNEILKQLNDVKFKFSIAAWIEKVDRFLKLDPNSKQKAKLKKLKDHLRDLSKLTEESIKLVDERIEIEKTIEQPELLGGELREEDRYLFPLYNSPFSFGSAGNSDDISDLLFEDPTSHIEVSPVELTQVNQKISAIQVPTLKKR